MKNTETEQTTEPVAGRKQRLVSHIKNLRAIGASQLAEDISSLMSYPPKTNTRNIRRTCKCGCGADISNKHPNALFLNKRHKDKYWNRVNPRGKFAPLTSISDECDMGWDSHK